MYVGDVTTKEGCKAVLEVHLTPIKEILGLLRPLQPKVGNNKRVEVVGSRSHMSEETLRFISELKSEGKEVEVVSKGSSLKFCLVAEGNADVYPRFAPTMEWDTAAGQAICNSVGIEVISKATDRPLLYNKENLLNPWFLVTRF